MKALDEAEFTIVGTGLMGSSLALALRGKVKRLHGIDRDPTARDAAAACFDRITADLQDAASSDVIILATPVRTILGLLDTFKTLARPGTLILDLGSSKQQIVQAMDSLPDYLIAIGGHPMAGKENSGPASADGALFQNRVFVLSSTQRSTTDALVFAENMVRAIGARPLQLSASRHDQAVASISHLPYAVSIALVSAVMQTAQADDTPWQLASSGFRDASRLAGSDTTMMGDTLLTNREAVLDALNQYRQQLDALESALRASDEEQLHAILETAKHARSDWFRHWNRSLP